MTRKDYQKIAAVFLRCNQTGRLELIFAMTDMLAQDNPAFDRERFLDACGI